MKNQINLLMSLIMCTLMYASGYAQQKTVTGIVTDPSNLPVPGVNVLIKGTQKGVSTDFNGKYGISVSPGETLVFSYLGFKTKEIKIGNVNSYNVTFEFENATLDEVVVVGYGTVKKKDLTGAIGHVKGSELKQQGVSDVTKTLQGRVAGVTVESSGGNPGAGTRILIRGVSSLNNSTPLYIVDGVQVSSISNLNSNDIESIDILKDASAAAIYGSRAANGVVLVTTKSGKAGEAVFNFSSNMGVQRLVKKLDVLNAEQWANVSNAAQDAAGFPRLDIAANAQSLGKGSDYQDAIYRDAMIRQYDMSVSGGSETGKYSVSGGYVTQDGIVETTDFNRYNIRVKSETKKGIFKFGETVFLSRDKQTQMAGGWGGQGGNPVGSAAKMIPLFDIYNPDAVGGYGGAYGPVVNVANPLAQLNLEHVTYESTNILVNAFAEASILPSLKYKFNLGYTNNFGTARDYIERYKVGSLFTHPTNDLAESKNQTVMVLLENTLNYTKDFGKHSIQALGGYTYQTSKYNYLSARKTNLPDGIQSIDAGAGVANVGGNSTQSALVSVLGRLNYSYDSRYLLSASIRRDGSSRFGSANRYGTFPSVALGWNISNEKFFEKMAKSVQTLKLRVTYGVLGNQEIGDYQYSANIASNINYTIGDGQTKWFGATQTAFTSPNIKWESTETANLGLDFGFFNNSLTGSVDYFYKKTTDILLNVPIPGSTGSSINPVVNAGTLLNHGVELGLNYAGNAGKLTYNVYGTLTSIKNKVEALGTGSQQIFGGQPTHHGATTTITEAGGPVSSFYLIKDIGIFQSQAEINSYVGTNGQPIQPTARPGDIKFFDKNGDSIINDNDKVYSGSPFPKFEYGFGANSAYENFDINVFFQGTSGNKIYNGLRQDLESTNLIFNYSTAVLNAWTPENTNTDIPRLIASDPNVNNRTSTRFLENGSYFRIKTLQLGYTLPKSINSKIGISSLRVYVSADNLATFTKYTGYNPDLGRTGSIFDRGVDFGHVAYPLARTISAGLQLSF
ncbi:MULTISPECIES: SusC/RagA family TonB-linked outer membrane protein [unclassified Flavobacterium]|jgi:TonB-linked SusC/RagA family outer membrane protein|uniref:SusC/RagA family TonB-linked outer membrane protein n=1 Tax=unclassified Flavobacterium TaxID=196869 RepID=UPI0025C67B25|nr:MULTISPECIES: TonB-dependent receptor [unclassified Flavobacterium]